MLIVKRIFLFHRIVVFSSCCVKGTFELPEMPFIQSLDWI